MLDLKNIRKQMHQAFEGKEDYLKWVAEWKINIKLIEAHIKMRKSYLRAPFVNVPCNAYEEFYNRHKLINHSLDIIQRNWQSQQSMELLQLRSIATSMYDMRVANKRRSAKMKQERLANEAAVA